MHLVLVVSALGYFDKKNPQNIQSLYGFNLHLLLYQIEGLDQWLVRYSPFYILRPSSMGGHLYLKFKFGLVSEDPISIY